MAGKRAGAPASTGETVTVALKSPQGFVLQLHDKQMQRVPLMGGGHSEEEVFRPSPNPDNSFRLNGSAVAVGATPHCTIIGGFAMTPGVPKDLWDAWLAQNPNLGIVKAGLICAHESAADAGAEAKEKRLERSGLEPLNMAKRSGDPRIPKRKNLETGEMEDAIQTAPEQAAA